MKIEEKMHENISVSSNTLVSEGILLILSTIVILLAFSPVATKIYLFYVGYRHGNKQRIHGFQSQKQLIEGRQ
jgi:hypothetical protein